MNPNCLQWLAHGLANQLAQLAARGHNIIAPFEFAGANETNVVTLIERSFTGLGYDTWREQRYPPPSTERYDLLAEPPGTSPNGTDAWMVEVKVVWDRATIGDGRLYRRRFYEERVILEDFRRLTDVATDANKLMVIVFFSDVPVPSRGSEALLRIVDVLEAIAQEYPNAALEGQAVRDFGVHCACDQSEWPCHYGHIYCWRVMPREVK